MALFNDFPVAEEKDMFILFPVAEFIYAASIKCRYEGILVLEELFDDAVSDFAALPLPDTSN